MSTATISQFTCFRSINSRVQLRHRLHPRLNLRSKALVVMSADGHGTDASNLDSTTTLSYVSDAPKSHNGRAVKPYLASEQRIGSVPDIGENMQENIVNQPKRAAKIHDFCFGIPFGGLVFSGGLVSFIFSRNPATLVNGVLSGGALLVLSTLSLKVWRQGKSSLPFILGQAALAASLMWKNFQSYTLTRSIFPTGLYAAISAAMLCFYSYVVISGGNPPPKKLKSSAATQ